MANLLSESEAGSEWANETIEAFKEKGIFSNFNSGVIWAEIKSGEKGREIPVNPHFLAEGINEQGQPLLLNHDPGKPIGRVVAARVFKAKDGRVFVGAVFGFYDGAIRTGFRTSALTLQRRFFRLRRCRF